MLDIKFIRDNLDLVKEAARKKKVAVDLDRLLHVDDERKNVTREKEELRAAQNEASLSVAKASSIERDAIIAKMRKVKEKLAEREEKLKGLLKEWQSLMVQVPNIPDPSVPEGDSDANNKEVRRVGEPPQFSFAPKSHVELMSALDMVDLERGAKVAGFRGYFLKNDGALLSYALWNFTVDHFLAKGDFTPIIAPSLLRREPFLGTGYLPQGEEDLYKTQDGEYLAGTSEVGVMGYFMDEVLEKKYLPRKFFAFSPCFRREAGSHGKDTKGIMRVHEFFKFEQVVLCEASHEESVKYHEELTKNSEELLQALDIPYHVVINCGADLGLGQVKKYDIEAWVPSEGKYRETHSSSYFHDFQTRRLNIRYRDEDGVMRFAHSLNNTALATPRLLIPLVENYQNADGTIRVPQALQKYTRKDVLRGK